jgi:hypothetical protein
MQMTAVTAGPLVDEAVVVSLVERRLVEGSRRGAEREKWMSTEQEKESSNELVTT